MMSELTHLWRYDRPVLAKSLVARAQTHERIALFGPRQTGKTSLLREEVMPLAEKAGMLPVYIECWADKADPLGSINYGLQKAIDQLTVGKGIARTLRTDVKKIGVVGTSIDFGEKPSRKIPDNKFLQVDALLTVLLNETKQDVLLVFDEFQALATGADAERSTAALRATLTQASKRVGVIFSGSSQVLLLETFSRARAPLYGFANPEPYPLLDEKFIAHVARKFHAATARELDPKAAMAVFDRLGRQPEPFLHAVGNTMAQAKWCIEQGMQAMLDPRVQNKWTVNWFSLTDMQRVALRLVFEGRQPSAKESLERAALLLGQEKVQGSTVTRALEALAERGLVERGVVEGDRGYRVIDPVMAAWLSTNACSRM
jgi:DNA-binding transcriptional ArsR family regulator